MKASLLSDANEPSVESNNEVHINVSGKNRKSWASDYVAMEGNSPADTVVSGSRWTRNKTLALVGVGLAATALIAGIVVGTSSSSNGAKAGAGNRANEGLVNQAQDNSGGQVVPTERQIPTTSVVVPTQNPEVPSEQPVQQTEQPVSTKPPVAPTTEYEYETEYEYQFPVDYEYGMEVDYEYEYGATCSTTVDYEYVEMIEIDYFCGAEYEYGSEYCGSEYNGVEYDYQVNGHPPIVVDYEYGSD